MDHAELFIEVLTGLLIFFGISGLVIPLLRRADLSPVLGYLLCGLAVGPAGIALFATDMPWLNYLTIQNPTTAQTLGELGIIALLFMIGLELSLQRLRELKKYVLGLGSLQILVCAAAIAGVASLFNNSIEASLLLGASLALSSTAIVMQLLSEKHLLNRPVGVLSFSILLMQDLAVVPILIMAGVFAGADDRNVGVMIVESLAIAAGTIILMYIVGKRFLRPLMNSLNFNRSPDILTAFTLFLVVGSAFVTHQAGLSAALGAFLAGLLIAETEFRHEIEVIIEPLKNLLLGLFFLSVGMMIDIREVMANPYWIIISVIGILMLKATIIYPLARLFAVPKRVAVKAAILLSQPGEFAFLILSVGMYSGLIPTENGQFFLLVTTLCMLLTPALFRLAPKAANLLADTDPGMAIPGTMDISDKDHVIIAGFGRIGQIIGQTLEKQKVPYRAIDYDAGLVHAKQQAGLPVIYGDSRRMEQWELMHIETAKAIIIAIDNEHTARDILHAVHQRCPNLPILMRAKDTSACRGLYDMGASIVVPEALESSLQIARSVMEMLDVDEEAIEEAVTHSRKLSSMGVE